MGYLLVETRQFTCQVNEPRSYEAYGELRRLRQALEGDTE
jgi:hypothetical protein